MNTEKIKLKIEELSKLSSLANVIMDNSFPMAKSSKKQLEHLEKIINQNLPLEFKDYYQKIGTFNIHWVYVDAQNPNIKFYGYSTLYEINYMLKHPDPNIKANAKIKYEYLLWNKGEPEEVIQELQNYYILDALRFDNYVLFKLNESSEIELFLYTRPHHLAKLNLNFLEYIHKQLKFKGIYLWQQYFVADPAAFPLIPDQFLRNINLFSPGIDLSDIPDQTNRQVLNLAIEVLDSKKNYLTRLQTLIQELGNHPELSNVQSRYNLPHHGTHPADFYRAYLALGYSVPPKVIEFYQTVNGLSLRWQTRAGTGMEADFFIPTLEGLFVEDDGKYMWVNRRPWNFNAISYFKKFGSLDSDQLEQLKDFHILYREERNITLLKMNADEHVELALMVDLDFYKLRLDFDEFIEALFEFKGAKYWQYLFVEEEFKAELGIPDDYLQNLQKLFPEMNLKKFSNFIPT